MSSVPPFTPPLARARELVAERREAEAAALLERTPGPEAAVLHREIALRAGTAALEAGALTAAAGWLDRGLARNPADPALNFFRGRLHAAANRPAPALACFRRTLAAEPAHEEAALACATLLRATAALAEAAALLAAFPDSARAQLLLAAVETDAGHWPAARAAGERACRLEPHLVTVWVRLAELCTRDGDRLGALLAWTRAAALHPADAAVQAGLGGVLQQMGQRGEARRAFEACLRLAPGDTAAQRGLAELEAGPDPRHDPN